MFATLLALHSLLRWLIVLSMVLAIVLAYRGWLTNKAYSRFNTWLHFITTGLASFQLGLGLWLYAKSTIVKYFLNNFSTALKQTQLRFFGMEHSSMMVLGIGLIIAGSIVAHRKKNSQEKFKTIAIWYSIAFIVIFFSIPWAFSPFTARPYFRFF